MKTTAKFAATVKTTLVALATAAFCVLGYGEGSSPSV
jgi:hypothetical protein